MRCWLILFILLPLVLDAQKQKDWIDLGDEAMGEGDYARSALAYEEGMLLDSSNFDLTVKYAESLRLSREYGRALWYYGKIYGKDRGQLFPEGQFHMASMQKLSGDYQAALRSYKSYLERVKRDKSSYFFLKAEQEIKACTFALKARRDSNLLLVEGLPMNLNSKSSDFAVAQGIDSSLFFSSHRSGRTLLYSIALSDTSYQNPVLLDESINADEFELGNPAFHPEESKMYFSRCPLGKPCQLYEAEWISGAWKNVKPIEGVNLDGFSSTMPQLSRIGKDLILFFSSNRPGGFGKMDVYWSQLGRSGFGEPINAGKNVNSIDNELSPFYFKDGLYFSSDWHEGFGGFDLFYSKGMPRSFQKPENLGFPFNTNANDLYWSYYPELNAGFISSNRVGSYTEEGEICCNDIYRFQYPDSITQPAEEPYASLEQLNDYLPVTLYFHNDEPDPRTLDTTTSIRYDQAYASYIKRLPEYLKAVTQDLKGSLEEETRFETEEFFSLYVDKGMEDLNIFSKLLLRELRNGIEVELSVKGFASPRAKSDYNLNLTKRRIQSLVNYLKNYESGVFLPFFEARDSSSGRLQIVEVPFGEYQADQSVSDALEDEKESIYTKAACLERKIEIRSVQRAAQDTLSARLRVSSPFFDFGYLSPNSGKRQTSFELINEGDSSVAILRIESPCGCTVARPEKESLAPGESVKIIVEFDPFEKDGIVANTVSIFISEQEDPLQFTIAAEVFDE